MKQNITISLTVTNYAYQQSTIIKDFMRVIYIFLNLLWKNQCR